MTRHIRLSIVALFLSGTVGTAAAQLPVGSARAGGMGDAFGAVARGFGAVYFNPANLGLGGNPHFSLGLPLQVRVNAGISPITLNDIKTFDDKFITDANKATWLAKIPSGGTEKGSVALDLSPISLSLGHLAISTGTIGRANVNLPKDAVELLLYGNAGASGNGKTFALTNGAFDAYALSTVGVSWGQKIPVAFLGVPGESFTVGVTGKYIVGHALAQGQDNGSFVPSSVDSIVLKFPTIVAAGGNVGSGIGMDIGAAWKIPRVQVGVTLTNVMNSFKFDSSKAYVLPLSVLANGDSVHTNTDSIPLSRADSRTRTRADSLFKAAVFKPGFRVSASFKPMPMLLLAGDIMVDGTTTSLKSGERTATSVGAEFRPLGFIPLRAGYGIVPGGTRWSVGAGLDLKVLNLDASYGQRKGTSGTSDIASIGLTIGGN